MKTLQSFILSSAAAAAASAQSDSYIAQSDSYIVANADNMAVSSKIPGMMAVITASIAAIIPAMIYLNSNKYFVSDSNSDVPSWLYKLVWAGAFLLNLVTVSLPGRFDGEASRESKLENGVEVTTPVWYTLFEPSGWAFAIWGVIYLTETILTVVATVVTQGNSQDSVASTVAVAFQKATPWWLAGNLFQALWCFAFRPAFKNFLWVPMSLLALGAVSFGGVHREFTTALAALPASPPFSIRGLCLLLMRFPLALHTGWLSAATLLNFNAWVSVSKALLRTQVSTAFLSAYIGAAVGIVLAVKTQDPFLALTVAWALAAVSSRTYEKVAPVDDKQKKPKDAIAVPPVIHDSLAFTEKWLSTSLVALAIGITALGTGDKVSRLF